LLLYFFISGLGFVVRFNRALLPLLFLVLKILLTLAFLVLLDFKGLDLLNFGVIIGSFVCFHKTFIIAD
jgi:hypothetical protein